MKKKLFSVLGVLMLMLALLPVSNASAYTVLYNGLDVNTAHQGLRAIISTGSANGSPPNFAFSAFSPDTVGQEWQFRIMPQDSCISAGVEFERQAGGSNSRVFFVENTCTGNRLTQTSLSDSTFRSKYVHTYTYNDTGTAFQDEQLDVRAFKISSVPVWQVQLYNYSTNAYDYVVNITGGTTVTGSVEWVDAGGTQQATGAYCPTLYAWNILEMRGLQRYTYSSGTWTTLASGDLSYYTTPTAYCFSTNTWKITHPNPWQWKLLPYGATY